MLILVLSDKVALELVETLKHGALDRLHSPHPPSPDLSAAIYRLSLESAKVVTIEQTGSTEPSLPDTGVAVRRVLSRRQAAEYLDRSVATVDRWRREGLLKATKVGGSVRFRLEDLERMNCGS
ncbi:MAG: helix-turn-helix domain-containing protein [Acidimicrobiia bacterium]